MASMWGRALRVVVGLILIWWGLGAGTTTGTVVAVIGVIPILTGIFNICVVAPLFGGPLKGKDALMGSAPQMPPQTPPSMPQA